MEKPSEEYVVAPLVGEETVGPVDASVVKAWVAHDELEEGGQGGRGIRGKEWEVRATRVSMIDLKSA
ncbi:hypothetical protein JHK85_016803 [Glycine max]|nr:hypothetical protein JHK85_016803 [Glycine max]